MNNAQVEAEKTLATADVAAATQRRDPQQEASRTTPERDDQDRVTDVEPRPSRAEEQLAPLFTSEVAGGFRSRWDTVQIGFVDDPGQAVRQADELVAQVMKSLAETFAGERARLESQLEQSDSASTENLRVALRRYRSFFQRLLSL
ncbi:MAG TPA: hypothetical protein VNN06_14885 [Ramlibacter sp.]|nr:hypothetical protein [Ramlibacter sp.]